MLALGEVVKTADQYYEFQKQCNALNAHLGEIKNSIDDRIAAEYGKKGEPASEMFKVIRSIRSIEQGVADLFEHKSKFVFSGDQTLLNKVFRDLRIDYRGEAERAKHLRKKDKGYNNTVSGVNYNRDVKNFNKLNEDVKHANQEEIDGLVEKL